MTKKIMQLDVATRVEIQITTAGTPLRFQTSFIGAIEERWFIVAMPDARRYGDYRDALHEGVPLIVRYILENDHGEIVAFRTDIDYIVAHPTKMLFLAWPERIESRVIRANKRFDAYLPITISRLTEEQVEQQAAVMVNVSSSGCRLSILPAQSSQWAEGDKIKLHVPRNDNQALEIEAIVRQIQRGSENHDDDEDHTVRHFLGLQFNPQFKPVVDKLFLGSLVDINALTEKA